MLEQVTKDYAAYFKLDVSEGLETVQEVIDNMITRLEELTSVVHMIKLKNSDCNSSVSDDINRYRGEVNTLSKKIVTLNEVIVILHQNVEKVETQVEKAEIYFGVNNDNKLTSLLRPFLKKNKDLITMSNETPSLETLTITSVLDNFENNS
ncbi:unnamed protein product [Parnassius apollo]|uniref:(apollo) hypothetical protein n=1 Tax=Parnassius apollo TaxID=110799 RepID=A0A8S3WZZ6_PARAO|nr:unnamed protein product [Parnassius apollo]